MLKSLIGGLTGIITYIAAADFSEGTGGGDGRMKLAVWIVLLLSLALVATGAWFWPPAGYGFVAEFWLDEDEQEATPQFRTVSAFSLAQCHANGLEGCLTLRSDGRRDVTVLVKDGLLQSHGELLTEGVSGGVLRYVAVMPEFHE